MKTLIAAGALIAAGGLFAAGQVATAEPSASPTAAPTASAGGDLTTLGGSQAERSAARVVWFYVALTDQQRDCLADQAVQRPAGTLDAAQREQLRAEVDAAIEQCGVRVPERVASAERLGFGWASLSLEQQRCLADQHPTRPVGRLTTAERQAVVDDLLAAARTCGLSV